MQRLRSVGPVIPLIILCTLVGCGKKIQAPVVFGNVKLDGQPLAGAYVFLTPKAEPALGTGSATTDPKGNFTIKADERLNNLVKPGTYHVLITKFETKGGDPSQPGGGMGATPVNLLPAEYADKSLTPLTVEIKDGENKLAPFELHSPK